MESHGRAASSVPDLSSRAEVQKKDVTMIKYRILNSFEEVPEYRNWNRKPFTNLEQKVVLIQERKRDLANLTFSNARLSPTDIGVGRLQYLRSALR